MGWLVIPASFLIFITSYGQWDVSAYIVLFLHYTGCSDFGGEVIRCVNMI
jgi:hypothetical protein